MPSKKFNAFISYSRKDGEKFANYLRQKLADDIDGKQLKLWKDREQMEGDKDWWVQITDACDESEYMILVVSPEALKSGICQKEWRYAREQGVCVRPVKSVADDKIEYQLLPLGMRDAHIYDIEQEWRKFVNDLNKTCSANRLVFMAPPLPRDYVERKEIFDFVKNKLLKGNGNKNALSSALRGSGGFGKTIMATAVCHNQEIIEHYHSGILWATIGEGGNLQREIAKIYRALTGEDNKVIVDEEEAARSLSEKLAQGKYLVVLDDVWKYADINLLIEKLKSIPETTVLITTRIDTVVLQSDSSECEVSELNDDQTIKYFTAGWEMDASHQSLVRDILKVGKGWIIFLKLIKSAAEMTLKKGESLIQTLIDIKEIYATEGLTAFDARDAKGRNDAIERCIGTSFSFLKPKEIEKCIMLGIFPTNVEIPLEVIYCLWQLEELSGKRLLQLLDDFSLVTLYLGKKVVKFHDVFLHYYREKLGNLNANFHKRLIDAWTDVYHLPNNYAWTYYMWHLNKAAEFDRAIVILQSFEWMEAKLFATNIIELLKDYRQFSLDEDTDFIYRALQLAAEVLAQDKSQLPAQLLGRLGYFENEPFRLILNKAKMWSKMTWLMPVQPALIPPGNLLKVLKSYGSAIDQMVIKDGKLLSAGEYDDVIHVWDISSGVRLKALTGNQYGVDSMLVKDNIVMASAFDIAIRIWDLNTGVCFRVLSGHVGYIKSLVYADGKVISGSWDSTIRIWDVISGSCLHVLQGHTGRVSSLLIYEDKIISRSQDNSDCNIRVWEIASGQCLQILRGHTSGITSLLINKGKIISASSDFTIRIWELSSGECLHIIEKAVDMESLFVNDGKLVSKYQETIHLWDLENGNCLRTLQGHTNEIISLLFLNKKIVSGSKDNTIRIWDMDSGRCLQIIQGHTERITSLLEWNNKVISGSWDSTIRIWDIDSGYCLQVLQGHTRTITSLLLYNDKLVSGSKDGTICIWDIEIDRAHKLIQRKRSFESELFIDKSKIVSRSFDDVVSIWELESGKYLQTLKSHSASISSLVVQDGKIVIGGADGIISVWDLPTGNCLQKIYGDSGPINTLLVKNSKIFNGSSEGTIYVWDMQSGKCLQKFKGHTAVVTLLQADHNKIFSAGDSTIRIWEMETGECIQILYDANQGVEKLLVHDGKVISSSGSLIRVHDLDSGKYLYWVDLHTNDIQYLLAYEDKIISASNDRTIRIWDLDSGDCMYRLEEKNDWIYALLVYEGKVISGSSRSPITFWNIETGEYICALSDHKNSISSLAIKDNKLYSTDEGGLMVIYDLETLIPKLRYYADEGFGQQILFDLHRIICVDKTGSLHMLEKIGQ